MKELELSGIKMRKVDGREEGQGWNVRRDKKNSKKNRKIEFSYDFKEW